jgi:hypothetical protein
MYQLIHSELQPTLFIMEQLPSPAQLDPKNQQDESIHVGHPGMDMLGSDVDGL